MKVKPATATRASTTTVAEAPAEFRTREAARRAGVCTKTILRWWHKGFITARPAGRDVLVDRGSLEAYLTSQRRKPGPKQLTAAQRRVRRRTRLIELLAADPPIDDIAQLATALHVVTKTVWKDIAAVQEELAERGLVPPAKRTQRALPPEPLQRCTYCLSYYRPRAWRRAEGAEQETCPNCAHRTPGEEYLTRAEQLRLLVLVYIVGSVEEVAGEPLRIRGTLDLAAARVGMSAATAARRLRESGYDVAPPRRRPGRRTGQIVECAAKRSTNARVREACNCAPRFVYGAHLRRHRDNGVTLSRGCARRLAMLDGAVRDEDGFTKLDRARLEFVICFSSKAKHKVARAVGGTAAVKKAKRKGTPIGRPRGEVVPEADRLIETLISQKCGRPTIERALKEAGLTAPQSYLKERLKQAS